MSVFLLIIGILAMALSAIAQPQAGVKVPEVTEAETQEETIAKCLEDLASADVARRRRAAMLIGKYDTPKALAATVRCLQDSDAQIRQTALVSLVEERSLPPEAAKSIFRLLKDENVHIRRLASSLLPDALGVSIRGAMALNPNIRIHAGGNRSDEENAEVLKCLNEALDDPDFSVCRNVLTASRFFPLGLERERIERLLHDSDKEMRCLALLAYMKVVGQESQRAAAVASLVDDPEPQVKTLVVALAGSLGKEGIPILRRFFEDGDSAIRCEAISKYVSQFNSDSFAVLREAIFDESLPLARRAQLCGQLRYFREEAPGVMTQLLKHPSGAIRAAALKLYKNGGFGELPLEYLMELVNADEAEIREQAVDLLQNRLKGVAPSTLTTLFASPHAEVRLLVLGVVRSSANPNAFGGLVSDALLDEDDRVRIAALRLMPRVRPDGWKGLLLDSLEDANLEVREAAALSLCMVVPHQPDVVEALKKVSPSLKSHSARLRVNNYLRAAERSAERAAAREQNRPPLHPRPQAGVRPQAGARPGRQVPSSSGGVPIPPGASSDLPIVLPNP